MLGFRLIGRYLLSSLKTSVEGKLLSKILGPELTSISLVIDSKPKRGLAAR